MQWFSKRILVGCASLLAVAALAWPAAAGAAGAQKPIFISVGPDARPPIGWLQFCDDHPADCRGANGGVRDVVLTSAAWHDLVRVNQWVNSNVKPITDLDHWGVAERWDYPDDGYGDCEDYVLLKRKMLLKAGWPRSALLVTVVRDQHGAGHAVLTVETDKGEFVLDNQNEKIVLWSESGYRFVKRQSQANQNVWVTLDETPASIPTASAH
ncbi:MAG TPA: transglutaminase-like cysteine peptidase [Xanthobacteraceae bacterium]|nr:transglutaminase-like cysteine peptidase [Xanthobacteraceae bacterium]